MLFVHIYNAHVHPMTRLHCPDDDALHHAGLDPARAARIGRTMQRLVDAGRTPALALRLHRRGTTLDWRVGSHHADGCTPLDHTTLMRQYSATKAMTSALLFSYFEEGRWLFADPLNRFLPELADVKVHATGQAPQRPITMLDLLTHNAGFAYGVGAPHKVDRLYAEARVMDFSQPIEALLAKVAKLPLVQEPGSGSHYSVAHDLQGLICERLGGRPLDVLMHERLFAPLGMKDARFRLDDAARPRLGLLHEQDAQGRARPVSFGGGDPMRWDLNAPPALISGGAGVIGTLDDEFRFLRMIAGGGSLDGVRVLAPATVTLMTTGVLDASATQPGSSYTPGWFSRIDAPALSGSCVSPGTLFTGGAGGNWGWIDPPRDLVVTGMLNVLGGFDTIDTPSWLFDPLVYQALDD